MKLTRIISIGLAGLLALVTLMVSRPFAEDRPAAKAEAKQAKKPYVAVTISKETTFITAPLRKDGYVNYVAALNQRFGAGVTPENNAAVPFLKAMGPGEIGE